MRTGPSLTSGGRSDAALNYIDRIARSDRLDTLEEQFAAEVSRYGFEAVGLVDHPSPVLSRGFTVLMHRTPAGWVDLYMDQDYARNDPILKRSLTSPAPFEWGDVRCDPERERGSLAVMRRAADHGLRHGFSFSTWSGSGPMSCVSMASAGRPDLDATTKPILHLIALYTLTRVQALRDPASLRRPRLSPREREVLTWVAAGKTGREIAEILPISERTVLDHVINATRKLGASSRTHAVAKAIAIGAIAI